MKNQNKQTNFLNQFLQSTSIIYSVDNFFNHNNLHRRISLVYLEWKVGSEIVLLAEQLSGVILVINN